jgi:hypothetical protein
VHRLEDLLGDGLGLDERDEAELAMTLLTAMTPDGMLNGGASSAKMMCLHHQIGRAVASISRDCASNIVGMRLA